MAQAKTKSAGGFRALDIGITVGLRNEAESLWINGIKQNALYLAKLFQHSPYGHRVTLVNTTDSSLVCVPWDVSEFPVRKFEDAKDELDVLIELGGQISVEATGYLKQRGVKLVSYCCGPEYAQNIEAMIFGRPLHRSIFINQQYDEVWVIPQVMETSAEFFRTLRRRPVREVPFVWDPMCLEQRCAELPHRGEYRPSDAPKRIAIMEPNIDVLKFCLYPLFIAEHAWRVAPERIGFVHVTNAEHLALHNPEFIGVVSYLDLVRDHRVSFVGRYDTPLFLAQHADIVISHQWGLALNYFYFDVCWKGYPLIHNAQLCRDLGYFYPFNDLEVGTQRVLEAATKHDSNWEEYRQRQREIIAPYISTHPALVEQYDALLESLMQARGA